MLLNSNLKQRPLFFVMAVLVCCFAKPAVALEGSVEDTTVAPELVVAILPFSNDENLPGVGRQAADLLNSQLTGTDGLVLVERAEIDKVFAELELGMSGTVDPATAARIGSLVGAKVIITGSTFTMGSEATYMAKIIGVETGLVYAQAVTQPIKETVATAVTGLSEKVAATLKDKGGSLLAKAETEDDFMERYTLALQGKDLPTVTVRIPEQHMNRNVIDPAAETEISLVLQQLGFPLLDPAVATKTADIEISGAAFSEYAVQNGNLITCKSRVEIKAVDLKTGEILAMDRETGLAVDISENIAGKLAIENATREIVKRMIPKIVP